MARATDEQVQQYVDERVRPRAEALRKLLAQLKDDKAAIDDVYAHVSGANDTPSTWDDNRTDAPPHLLTKDDVLAYNSFITALIPHIEDASYWPVVLKSCVRPVE
jgi:hypothetical protein